MTRTPLLRDVPRLHYQRSQAVARWLRDGHPVQLSRVPRQGRYISFYAQGRLGLWQGLIDSDQWLQAIWPQWSQVLGRSFVDNNLLELFRLLERPLELPPQLLDYQHLFDVQGVDGAVLEAADLPCIATDQGPCWVLGLPADTAREPRALQPWTRRLQQTLRVVLGETALTPLQLRRLAEGDLLMIAGQTCQLLLAGRCIGQFTFIEEGLHMELTPEDIASDLAECAVSPLPVKLQFVLAELTLSMAQLNDFIEHQVLPLGPEALQQVEVRVGERCIAIGELVRLDGRLGLELREVYRGPGNE